jgi:hypothetical protein
MAEEYEPLSYNAVHVDKCFPQRWWVAILVIALLVAGWLGEHGHHNPEHVAVIRCLMLGSLVLILGFLLRYVYWLASSSFANASDISRKARIEEGRPRSAAVSGRAPSPPMVVARAFVKIMLTAWISFTMFTVVAAVPDYLSSNSDKNNEMILHLADCDGAVTAPNVARLLLGAAYFCAGTLATVGTGSTEPGGNPWGRSLSLMMTLFDIFLIPIVAQYILGNQQLALAVQSRVGVVQRRV